MNVVMIIPTGIGCKIGGHSGDATPAAKLLASVCDTLILHPNVVNAADLNEMPRNAWYVDGGTLDSFFKEITGLTEPRYNKILLVTNNPVHPSTVNAVSAAYHSAGIKVELFELSHPLIMKGGYDDKGMPSGNIIGIDTLVSEIENKDFDALAVHTFVEVPIEETKIYFEKGGLNPYGKVESMLTQILSVKLNKPVAHAPVLGDKNDLVDYVMYPRIAAEGISGSMLFCVLKGLHTAPRWGDEFYIEDVNCLVTPFGCRGVPHDECIKRKIPIIIAEENSCEFNLECPGIIVKNYWEAAGYIAAMREGISPLSCRI